MHAQLGLSFLPHLGDPTIRGLSEATPEHMEKGHMYIYLSIWGLNSTMVEHGRPRSTIMEHGQQQSTMIEHGRPRSTIDHMII